MKVPSPWGCDCRRAKASGHLRAGFLAESTMDPSGHWEVARQDAERVSSGHWMRMMCRQEEACPWVVVEKVGQSPTANRVEMEVLEASVGLEER